MKLRFLTTLLLGTLLLSLTSCLKGDTDGKTTYVLKPLVQQTSGDLNEPLSDIIAYAFDADTTEWTVASYDDAVAGILTHKELPSEQLGTPIASAEPYTVEGMTDRFVMTLPDRPVMVLVVDHINRLYAYTNQELEPNMGSLFVTLIFKPWKEATAYKEGWSFYNPFYEPPKELELFARIGAQMTEGGAEQQIENLKLYAFAADTTLWRVASYDDAVAGIITLKSDEREQRTTPEFNAYATNEEMRYRMKVTQPTLMLVAVDRTHGLYAYTKREVDLEGASPTYELLFRPWQPIWISEEAGWQVINPEYEPTPEEEGEKDDEDDEDPTPENPTEE